MKVSANHVEITSDDHRLVAGLATDERVGLARAGRWRRLRCWDRQGRYEIAVFTAPNPFVAGPVDISVLVLDSSTGEPVLDAIVIVEVAPRDRPDAAESHPATSGAATNKLFYAALFDIAEPGPYSVEVVIEKAKEVTRARFVVEVADDQFGGMDLWPWICWPAPVIVLYGIHQWLVWRKGRDKSR